MRRFSGSGSRRMDAAATDVGGCMREVRPRAYNLHIRFAASCTVTCVKLRTNYWYRQFWPKVAKKRIALSVAERYDTAYACEGKTLEIECGEGKLIHLIRANYGRFSITICNEHGNTEWSVNCMSPKSYRVLNNE